MKLSDADKHGLFAMAFLGMIGIALVLTICGILYSVFTGA